jgi:hypothetical protein
MTPLQASAQHIRGYAPAGGGDIALPTAETPAAAHRTQPVERVHEVHFRAHGRPGVPGRARHERQQLPFSPPPAAPRMAETARERLSPPAKFGNSVPAMAQLMAHDSGYLSTHMPSDMRAFSRYAPVEAYQATLDRSLFILRDLPPLSAAA